MITSHKKCGLSMLLQTEAQECSTPAHLDAAPVPSEGCPLWNFYFGFL
jgi:hypothetical protein